MKMDDFQTANIVEYLQNVHIHQHNIEADVKIILSSNTIANPANFAAWLLKAISVIDLTTLAGDDTKTNVIRLCVKAANPLPHDLCKSLGFEESNVANIRTAAVCVYPARVSDAYHAIKRLGMSNRIPVAAVATGFPSGLFPLETRLREIEYAVSAGASEIDVVIDRSLVLSGKWSNLFDEVSKMREACGKAHLKVILGVGELGTLANVYKASMVAMTAGADFIKTSTGKEAINATLPVGLVMCRAIQHYYQITGKKVGLKPAGGIKTPLDAVHWLVLVKHELGNEWLTPNLFRIGASSLLGAMEKWLNDYAMGETGQTDKFNFI